MQESEREERKQLGNTRRWRKQEKGEVVTQGQMRGRDRGKREGGDKTTEEWGEETEDVRGSEGEKADRRIGRKKGNQDMEGE